MSALPGASPAASVELAPPRALATAAPLRLLAGTRAMGQACEYGSPSNESYKSACASMCRMVRRSTVLLTARTVGNVIEWSPPRMMGRTPVFIARVTPSSIAALTSSPSRPTSPASVSTLGEEMSTSISDQELPTDDFRAARI